MHFKIKLNLKLKYLFTFSVSTAGDLTAQPTVGS